MIYRATPEVANQRIRKLLVIYTSVKIIHFILIILTTMSTHQSVRPAG